MSMLFILDPVDKVVFTWINYDFSHPWLDPIMIFLSSKWTFIPAYVFILYLYFNRFGKRIWIPVLLTVAAFGLADSVSSRVLKPLTQRTRPVFEESMNAPIAEKPVRLPHEKPGSRYGFVSSHSANMFAVLGIATMLLGLTSGRSMVFYAVAVAVAYSRVYLGVHYPGDVVFGGLLGYTIARLLYALAQNRGWLSERNTEAVVPLQ
jgi:undecaprenyl-diphosphatase